ncbi:rubredoxin [Mucilaginibacter sp. BJC16-A38]|nr:rubredoxin [Mucilaginibacter phenanthrenivorans]
METFCVKINLPGGVISAGDLYEILQIAENAGANAISVGNRQQLYFCIPQDRLEDLEMGMLQAAIDYEINSDQFPNIISSYVTDNIFNTESWLKEGVYKDIFDLFNFQPELKVNLVDKHQTFVPFFSGNFNFISSDVSNYWYLYIRFPKTNELYCWPCLVYSDDIPTFCKVSQEAILGNKQLFYDQPEINYNLFYEKVITSNNFINQQIAEPLKLPDFSLSYYEGFNKYLNDKYWLGIYRRNELFPIAFLKDVCSICLKTRVGQLYTTPWKSFLIKGINEADRKDWGFVLNNYRINVRHAANELNWQLENLCKESLELKKQLVREFEEYDLRTYRLCFAIKMQPKTGLLASIIIKKVKAGLFDILHTRDFNPNSKDFVVYKQKLPAGSLGQSLIELCNFYYELLIDNSVLLHPGNTEDTEIENDVEIIELYQCKNCLSIYDKNYGDPVNGIPVGTDFKAISDYECPVCESRSDCFIAVEKQVHHISKN